MEKSHILDILSDIKFIHNKFQAFKEVETFEEFYIIAKAIVESVKTIEINFFYDGDNNEWLGTELYAVFEDNDNDDIASQYIIVIDYECWFCLETNEIFINRCGYAIRIGQQIIDDVDDAFFWMSYINKLKDNFCEIDTQMMKGIL